MFRTVISTSSLKELTENKSSMHTYTYLLDILDELYCIYPYKEFMKTIQDAYNLFKK